MEPDQSRSPLNCGEETQRQDVEQTEPEGRWGFRSCQPRRLQFLNSIRWMVVFMCIFNFVEGFIANGIINVIILALEVRYQLSSKRSGLIISGNDFGSFVVLLFIGHFSEGRHKPRIMAAGVLSMALGSLIFALPHFIGKPYTYVNAVSSLSSPDNTCSNNSASSTFGPGGRESPEEADSGVFYFLFLLGQIFLGIGACPMFTIGLTYIDESSKPKMTSLYTSLVMCFAALGVAAGYVAAGYTLAIYVDVDKVDASSIDITPADPRWVGAWWIGVVASFVAFLVIVPPFCAYPKRLPGYNALKRVRKSEAHGGKSTDVTVNHYKGKLTDYPKALLKLVKNPTFMLLCLAACCEALIIAGTASFGAKILQQFFHVDIMKAGTIMGIITIPGAGGGMILGGYLVKRLDLRCTGIIKLCAGATFVSLLLAPSFLARCEQRPIAGVTVPYASERDLELESACNAGCGCTLLGMEPLCLDERVVFFSPCHAGCPSKPANQTWDPNQCRCTKTLVNNSWGEATTGAMHWVTTIPQTTDSPPGPFLKQGMCSKECLLLYVFCALFLCIMLCTFSTLTPNVTAIMRCVQHDERSLAVGLQILAIRSMGTTPGPVLFGALFDSSCVVWQEVNGGEGTCWVYDVPGLAVKVLVWWVGIKLAALLVYCLALYVYKPPSDDDKANTGSYNSHAVPSITSVKEEVEVSVGHDAKL